DHNPRGGQKIDFARMQPNASRPAPMLSGSNLMLAVLALAADQLLRMLKRYYHPRAADLAKKLGRLEYRKKVYIVRTPRQESAMARFNLNINDELDQTLEHIASQTQTTKSEILRKALTLYTVAFEAKNQGKKIGFGDGKQMTTEIVGL
ncbi:secreted protein, partial [mine drainage metagenome]